MRTPYVTDAHEGLRELQSKHVCGGEGGGKGGVPRSLVSAENKTERKMAARQRKGTHIVASAGTQLLKHNCLLVF